MTAKYRGFKLETGRDPEPGRDFDPDGPNNQDDYGFLTGTGRYTNNPDEVTPEDCLVLEEHACPECLERDIDCLTWIDDDTVRCETCGATYQPGLPDLTGEEIIALEETDWTADETGPSD